MRSSARSVRFAAAILTSLLAIAVTAPIFADSYSVTVVANTPYDTFYGIDNAGDFVVNLTASVYLVNPGTMCGSVSNPSQCFETFYVGRSQPVFSLSPPALAYDNGGPCSVFLGGINEVCNNGHVLFGVDFPTGLPGQDRRGVWISSGYPIATYISGGSLDGGFINGNGDAVYVDGFYDELIAVTDLTTSEVPEPGSWTFASMGMIVLFVIKRGKLRRYSGPLLPT